MVSLIDDSVNNGNNNNGDNSNNIYEAHRNAKKFSLGKNAKSW